MSIQELESQLLSLTPDEKVEAIQLLSRSLNRNWRGITKTPGICGEDACIAGTRIPVWVLVGYRRQGVNESELLAAYPTLSASDLFNAWIYAEAHLEEIETTMQENQEA